MPEITDSELRQFVAYQNIGTPQEIQKKISDLTEDNRKYRQEEKPALEEKLPGEGQVVVDKSDAELLPKYKALDEDPDQLKVKLEEGSKAQVRLAEVETKNQARAFAKAAGLAEESVETLVSIPALKDAKFEVRKVKVDDGKGNKVDGEDGYLTLAGDDEKAMSFKDAQEKVPALKGLRTASPEETKSRSVNFVKQGSEENGKAGTVYDRIRQNREAEKKTAKDAPQRKPVTERLGMSQAQ